MCIQICFVSTEKNYAHHLACILFYTGVEFSIPYTTQLITNKQAFKSDVKKVL